MAFANRFRRLLQKRGLLRPDVSERPLQERDGYETVFDDDTMAVLFIPGSKDNCVVSFTGVGHGLGGMDLQSPEFSRSGGDETRIFVIDKRRSWGNGIDWDRLSDIVEDLAPDAEITTLGNSMGGFLAILSAPILGAGTAIAFAPQWSVDPEIVPEEMRWMQYRREISQIRYPDLSQSCAADCRIFVFFGDDRDDRLHIEFFRQQKMDLFVLNGGGHDVAAHLKRNGVLYPLVSACRSGADVGALLGRDPSVPPVPHHKVRLQLGTP